MRCRFETTELHTFRMKEGTKEQTIASLTQSRSPFDSESGNCDLYMYINISEYSKCVI